MLQSNHTRCFLLHSSPPFALLRRWRLLEIKVEERIIAVSLLFVFIPLLLFQAKSNESSVDDISSHKTILFGTGFSFFLPKLESCLSGMNQKGMLKITLVMPPQCTDSRLSIMIHVEDLIDGPSVLAILWS